MTSVQSPVTAHSSGTGPPPTAGARERFAWAMYDFANSGYTTVVQTAVFNTFFVAVIAGALPGGTGTLLWTFTIGLANAIVLVTGPLVGAVADALAWKKRCLLATTIGCVFATALLGLTGPGDIAFAMTVVVVAHFMFASGENLIAAFLPEIVPEERIGRMSGYGWGLGYLGGLATLALCLAYVQWASARGVSETDYVPVTLWITAAIFAIAATPTFIWLRERATPSASPATGPRAGLARLRTTLSGTRHFTDLFRFLLALVVFQSGVNTVVVLAAVYAREVVGFESRDLIGLIMVVNVAAAAGSFAMGQLQDRIGSVPALAIGLTMWILAIVLVLVADDPRGIWVAGNVIGVAMGASQAGGRALVGRLTPTARSGEFFGLWGMANRLASILGPSSYGLIAFATGGNQRWAAVSTLVFFIAGLALLARVNEPRGILAAHGTDTPLDR